MPNWHCFISVGDILGISPLTVSIPNNLLNINFGATAVLDSCFLNLAYDFDYYGDTLSQ